ncbi:MAG: DNA repair protein [Oscillospiraceae bacterium]|nr:DNA repair protein [Oscillospiraceae bacterium]
MAETRRTKLNRQELLELLVAAKKQIGTLETENAALRAQLSERDWKLEQAGNLAEAALSLSGVFESAQKAAELYLDQVRAACPLPESERGHEAE